MWVSWLIPLGAVTSGSAHTKLAEFGSRFGKSYKVYSVKVWLSGGDPGNFTLTCKDRANNLLYEKNLRSPTGDITVLAVGQGAGGFACKVSVGGEAACVVTPKYRWAPCKVNQAHAQVQIFPWSARVRSPPTPSYYLYGTFFKPGLRVVDAICQNPGGEVAFRESIRAAPRSKLKFFRRTFSATKGAAGRARPPLAFARPSGGGSGAEDHPTAAPRREATRSADGSTERPGPACWLSIPGGAPGESCSVTPRAHVTSCALGGQLLTFMLFPNPMTNDIVSMLERAPPPVRA